MDLQDAVIETIEDDVQQKIDGFFEKLTQVVLKEAKELKEEQVREVCVDHSHVDPEFIKQTYSKLIAEAFEPYALCFYVERWKKACA